MKARRTLAAAVIVVVCVAPAAHGSVTRRVASGTLAEYDQINAVTGTLTVDRTQGYDDHTSARATFKGGANGFARGVFKVDWHEGDDVWFGVALDLPLGFTTDLQAQVDLVRWDNWGLLGSWDDRSGVVIHGDGRAALMRMRFGVENVDIAPSFEIPEGRWVWLEVHEHLTAVDGEALNEVYLDGQLVTSSTVANTYGRDVDRIRYGIVAIDQTRQSMPLTVWFDRATVSPRMVGPYTPPAPVAAPPVPEPAPAPAAQTPATAPAPTPAVVGVGSQPPTSERRVLEDLAAGRPTTASSRLGPAFPSGAATDDSATTEWASRPSPHPWWRVDLERVRALRRIQITWGHAHPARAAVELSRDAHTWRTAVQQDVTRGGAGSVLRLRSRARFVRVRALSGAARTGIAIRRVRVLGVP